MLFTLCLANPSGSEVLFGDAVMLQPSSQCLQITTGHKTIIHWQDFSIKAGETTQFIQPDNQAIVLNRVVGNNFSVIQGQIQANGKVYLLNSNGILMTQSAVINTAAFIASTLDFDNNAFIQGDDLLLQSSGKAPIINKGFIHAKSGDVFLIAYQIENQGIIETDTGITKLVRNQAILLQPRGENSIFIKAVIPVGEKITDPTKIAEILKSSVEKEENIYSLAINQDNRVDYCFN